MALENLKPGEVEKLIGIECYVTRSAGVGGVIKLTPEDFQTWEVLVDGLDARAEYESWRGLSRGLGDLVLAVMRKRRIDTIRAATALAKLLGISPSDISACGIKDKMSVSWQFITLPSEAAQGELKIDAAIHVLPIRYESRRLSSRSLAKNLFEILVRMVRGSLEDAEACLEELREKGLPNFYGHQRFGIARPITPIAGRYLIEGRLEEAVKAFLADYSPLESPRNMEARKRLSEDFDPGKALQYFPRTLRYERAILSHLARRPGDYLGALRSLPLRLRRILVESVSAQIFNKALSRIISAGLLRELEVGDLAVRIDRFGRPEPGRPIEVTRGNARQVERLIERGRCAIALPVPGYLSPMPRSGKGEILLRVMDELELEFRMFRLKALPEASTRGSIRPLTVPRWDCRISESGESSLRISMSLPPGSYATILLREVMKPETPLAFIGKTVNSCGPEVSG